MYNTPPLPLPPPHNRTLIELGPKRSGLESSPIIEWYYASSSGTDYITTTYSINRITIACPCSYELNLNDDKYYVTNREI